MGPHPVPQAGRVPSCGRCALCPERVSPTLYLLRSVITPCGLTSRAGGLLGAFPHCAAGAWGAHCPEGEDEEGGPQPPASSPAASLVGWRQCLLPGPLGPSAGRCHHPPPEPVPPAAGRPPPGVSSSGTRADVPETCSALPGQGARQPRCREGGMSSSPKGWGSHRALRLRPSLRPTVSVWLSDVMSSKRRPRRHVKLTGTG